MKSTEFIFALVLVLMLSETSSSPSIFSIMYVPRSTELAQLGLDEMMWGDNTVDWERLHTTVSMQTRDGQKAGCKYRVSVVPVDGDGLPVAVMRGQARELGCEVQLCGLNDGDEECVMSNGNYSDVMGKCHLSIPTSLAEAGNGYRWVGVESTAISVEAGCQLSSESLPGLTALLEPYTAVYECASDEFWSQDVQECLPCETDDTAYLCSPGFYVKGCDSLAHVLDESTICSPCPNTPVDFASGHYRWKEGEECVLECDQGLFYMNGTVCEPCTELLRTCTDEESNYCCAKQAGQMWRACTATENEACVDCPAISKSIYSENEEFIPWSHECEHYLQEDGYLCECHTTCKDGFYRSLEPDLLDSLPCVPCNGMVDLAVQARLTRTSNEFFRYQQCTKASNTQLVQCVGKPIGCDGVPYSTVVVDICGVCGGSNDTCTGCDGVIASGKIEDACGLCDGDNTTCAGCDGVPNSGLVVDVCDQCGGDNTSCWGCDNISNSGLVFDACGECGGDGSSCWGCDNVSNSGLVFDACDVCGGDNATCTGCDGVLFSGKVVDSCGVCDGGDQAQDGCGVCYGDNTSCVGCDGIFKSGVFDDSCGVCGGNNSTCAGCDGIPYSGKVIDSCNVCGGDNTSCIGCDGVLNSGKKIDECNVCGGDNTTCECDIGYTGPQYGKLSSSCVLCGPGTYKDVIGSAACTECGFDTYNPQHGSTSSDACLPCMEHSETEEIYGHESIHACMCVSGYYHDTPTSCTACIPGRFNAEKNQTQCSNCSAGYYSNGPNTSTCEICPNATYSHEGSALCTPCNLNASSLEGSDSIGDCVCDVGFYSDITEHSQFGKVSTEVASGAISGPIIDVNIATNGQWAVVVSNYDVKHVNLMSSTKTITIIAHDVSASGICFDSNSTKMFFYAYGTQLRQYSMPADPNLGTIPTYTSVGPSNLWGNDRARGDCSVTSDGHLIATDWYKIYEFSTSTGLRTKTYNIGATYTQKIRSLTVTGENDNIILFIYMSKVWMIDRGGSSWVQLPTSGSGWNINQFNNPSSLTMSNDRQTVYFLTTTGIGAINYATGSVSTVAGHDVTTTTGDDGCTDGPRNEATFDISFSVSGMSVSLDGMYLLVPGSQCNNIRRVELQSQVTSHCLACAAGTYKDVLGPQACEPCASCPAGQYRLGCTTSSPGACVDCPSCGEGQYRVNCANQSTGECMACLAPGNITWYLEDADEGLTGGSSPDQSCDEICAEHNMVCDQSTLDGPIRYNNEAPALLFLEDIVRDSGYDQLSGSVGYNAVGDNDDACRIVPYFGYYSYRGYGYWTPEAREEHACTQTSQCSAIASDIPLSTSYNYQRLCPCTCGANHYVNGCGGTNSGVCTPCETCPSGQYRQNCVLHDSGVCVDCATCPAGQYLEGCSGFSAGTCVDCATQAASVCEANTYLFNCGGSYGGACSPCPSCPAGEQRNGCTGVSAGSCEACPSGTFKSSAGTEPCQTCPTCSAGTYNIGTCDALNGNTCADCVAGKYSNVAGLSACLDCPAGNYSLTSGRTTCTACAGCPVGEERTGCITTAEGTCQACAADTYKNSTSSQPCDVCQNCPELRFECNAISGPGVCVDCPDAVGTLMQQFHRYQLPDGNVGSQIPIDSCRTMFWVDGEVQPTSVHTGYPQSIVCIRNSVRQELIGKCIVLELKDCDTNLKIHDPNSLEYKDSYDFGMINAVRGSDENFWKSISNPNMQEMDYDNDTLVILAEGRIFKRDFTPTQCLTATIPVQGSSYCYHDFEEVYDVRTHDEWTSSGPQVNHGFYCSMNIIPGTSRLLLAIGDFTEILEIDFHTKSLVRSYDFTNLMDWDLTGQYVFTPDDMAGFAFKSDNSIAYITFYHALFTITLGDESSAQLIGLIAPVGQVDPRQNLLMSPNDEIMYYIASKKLYTMNLTSFTRTHIYTLPGYYTGMAFTQYNLSMIIPQEKSYGLMEISLGSSNPVCAT